MTTAPILVTGAAGARRDRPSAQGSTGHRVARLLLERGQPVRAFVHGLDERSDELRELGAEVVEGDLLEVRSVRPAFDDVRRAFFTYPVRAGLVEATAAFAVAARAVGAELVVNLSQLLQRRGDQPTAHQSRHWVGEQVLDWAGVGAVHLNPPVFYENLRGLVGGSLAQAGVVALPWGPETTAIPMVSAEDVARVAVGLLTGSANPARTVLPLIGSVVTNKQIAEAFKELLGRPVPYVELSDEQWLEAVSGADINDVAIEHLSDLWRFIRTRPPEEQAAYWVSTDIEQIGGAPPISLQQFLSENKDAFGATERPAA